MTDKYQIGIKDNTLLFATGSYKAEKESILHSFFF